MIDPKFYFILLAISCFLINSCQPPVPEAESPRLEAVRVFLDNVLEKGKDRWSGNNTPLLVDGINVDTGEPVKWIYRADFANGGPNGDWIIHNLASQQNLFRAMVGMTNLTGDKKYRTTAENSIKYHFDHLQSECGLLRWGGHQFIDLQTLQYIPYMVGTPHYKTEAHEFKNHFPFYELMWEVDTAATAKFLRSLWNAHILDWDILDMNRHGKYGMEMGYLWENEFANPEPFFEASGLTFLNAGSDLIYAGSMLYMLNGEEGAFKWAKLLAEQYVKARHPKTGLGVYQYSKMRRTEEPPAEGPVPNRGALGDRAENQFGGDFPGIAREGWVLFSGSGIYTLPALVQLELAERMGQKGEYFLKTTIEGMKAYAQYAYMPETNQFRPMWADGTDLTDYAFPRTGYYGNKGRVLKPSPADEVFLFSYARAYRLSKDPYLLETVNSIVKGLGLGIDILTGGMDEKPVTDNANPFAIFALLEMYRATGNQTYLKLAETIGDNILKNNFHNGFFLPSENHINANFNTIEPLALLTLEASIAGKPESVPVYSGGRSYIHGWFEDMGRTYDSRAIWPRTRELRHLGREN